MGKTLLCARQGLQACSCCHEGNSYLVEKGRHNSRPVHRIAELSSGGSLVPQSLGFAVCASTGSPWQLPGKGHSVSVTGSPGTPRARRERRHTAGSWQRQDLPCRGPALIAAFLQKQSGNISSEPGRDLGTAWQLTVWATDAGIWRGRGGKAGEEVEAAPQRVHGLFPLLRERGGQENPLLQAGRGSGAD